MTIVISGVSQCAGGNHITVTGTINGQAASVDFLASEFTVEPSDYRPAFIDRVRSAVKEAGASTPPQIKNLLEGKTYKL